MKVHEFSIGWALKQPDAEAALQRVMDNVKNWTSRKSDTFSAIAGESVTRMDVIKAHAALGLVGVVMVVAGMLEGGAL